MILVPVWLFNCIWLWIFFFLFPQLWVVQFSCTHVILPLNRPKWRKTFGGKNCPALISLMWYIPKTTFFTNSLSKIDVWNYINYIICRRELFNKSFLIENEMKMFAKNILQLIVVKLETFLVNCKRKTNINWQPLFSELVTKKMWI